MRAEPSVVVDDEDGRSIHASHRVADRSLEPRCQHEPGDRESEYLHGRRRRSHRRRSARRLKASRYGGRSDATHDPFDHDRRPRDAGRCRTRAGGRERSVRFSWSDSYAVQHDCGIVEAATVDVRGTAYFANSGAWIKDNVGFKYEATYSGPGGSLLNRTNQVATFTPEPGVCCEPRGRSLIDGRARVGTVVYLRRLGWCST